MKFTCLDKTKSDNIWFSLLSNATYHLTNLSCLQNFNVMLSSEKCSNLHFRLSWMSIAVSIQLITQQIPNTSLYIDLNVDQNSKWNNHIIDNMLSYMCNTYGYVFYTTTSDATQCMRTYFIYLIEYLPQGVAYTQSVATALRSIHTMRTNVKATTSVTDVGISKYMYKIHV